MLNLVNENDSLYYSEDKKELISWLLPFYGDRPGFKRMMNETLEQAQKERVILNCSIPELEIGYEEEDELFFIIQHDFYEPRNLTATLFDKICDQENDDYLESVEYGDEQIDLYLGKLEEMESLDLSNQKQVLKQINGEMHKAIFIFAERDVDDEKELEEYSDQIEQTYLEPIANFLEEILVEIATQNNEPEE